MRFIIARKRPGGVIANWSPQDSLNAAAAIAAFSTALRHVKAGKLRAVGVGGGKRNPQAPDVPSISEVLPGYSAASWTGLFAPPNTPAPVVETLRGAMVEILKMPDVQKRLVHAGDEPAAMTPGEVATFLREERQRWEKVIRTAGITAQ